MIERLYLQTLEDRLVDSDAVALLGPRQVGKTTLAHTILRRRGENAVYLDLESDADRRKLSDPEAYLSAHADRLVILDEIQRVPELFPVLRGQIDMRRQQGRVGGHFLILGSASMELLRQSSESLAGRISQIELPPLQPQELFAQTTSLTNIGALNMADPAAEGEVDQRKPLELLQDIENLWHRGGFPKSYLARNDAASLRWRLDFIRTYLERDMPQFGLRVAADPMENFWRMLANDQGGEFTAERFADGLDVTGKTAKHYLAVLEKLLLVRTLGAWASSGTRRLIKKPKVYVRDPGLLHALLGIRSHDQLLGNRVVGKSWEGFVIEALIHAAGSDTPAFFYRSAGGAELDLVLEFSGAERWAIEIKKSTAPSLRRGFHAAAEDIKATRKIVIHAGPEAFPMSQNVHALPLRDAIRAARQAGFGGL